MPIDLLIALLAVAAIALLAIGVRKSLQRRSRSIDGQMQLDGSEGQEREQPVVDAPPAAASQKERDAGDGTGAGLNELEKTRDSEREKREQEARRKAEQEQRENREQEARRKAEQEQREKREQEARRKAEQEQREKREQEARRKAEQEQREELEQEARRKAEQEARRRKLPPPLPVQEPSAAAGPPPLPAQQRAVGAKLPMLPVRETRPARVQPPPLPAEAPVQSAGARSGAAPRPGGPTSAADSPSAALERRDPRHREARHFAAQLVSEVMLQRNDASRTGLKSIEVYAQVKQDLARCAVLYRERVAEDVRARFDYLHDEVVKQLSKRSAGKPDSEPTEAAADSTTTGPGHKH